MLDIKDWLSKTGYKAAEIRFLKPPQLPYIIFTEEQDIGGADDLNNIINRKITVELYSEGIDSEAEMKIENLINDESFNFKKNRTWIESEKFFQTMYDFEFVEKR